MIRCNLCGETVPDVFQAIREGWAPSYWDEHQDREVCEPVCEACALFVLETDRDGAYLPVCLTVAE